MIDENFIQQIQQEKPTVQNPNKRVFESDLDFSQYIEKEAIEKNSNVLDVLIDFIEENMIDPEKIKPLIAESLKQKLKIEFIDRGMLQGSPSLGKFLK